MLYYGKKLVIFMISVGLLSLVTFYVSRLAPGDPLFSYYGERVEKMSPEESILVICQEKFKMVFDMFFLKKGALHPRS